MICTHIHHEEGKSCKNVLVSCNKVCYCCRPLQMLFTDCEDYSPLADLIDRELSSAIQPIISKWAKTVKLRDLEYLSNRVITEICLEILALRKVN